MDTGDLLIVLVMLSNFYLAGVSRLNAVIKAAALQGVVLGLIPLFVPKHLSLEVGCVAAATVVLKGIVIPWLLNRAMREASIGREMEPLLDYIPAMIILMIGTGIGVTISDSLPLAAGHEHTLIAPASFATVLTGFILLTCRHKAIAQVIGFLVLENGVFTFGLLLLDAMPLLVEVGALLDLFVAVFVMAIIINQIQRTFSSLDTFRLSSLKG